MYACLTGASNKELAGKVIDTMEPSSREDFEKFGEALKEKITKYEASVYKLFQHSYLHHVHFVCY